MRGLALHPWSLFTDYPAVADVGGARTRLSWPISVAQCRFAVFIKEVKREPQTITRHGKPVAVALAAADYGRLIASDAEHPRSFVDWLLAMPKDDGDFEPREVDFGPP